MFRGRFLLIGLIGLLLVGGLMNMGRHSAYQQGWMQGYYAGQQAEGEGGETTFVPPYAPHGPMGDNGRFHHSWGFSSVLWGVGSFVKCLVAFLVLGFLFRLFCGRRHWGGPGWGKHWAHGPKHHGKWESEPVDDTIHKA